MKKMLSIFSLCCLLIVGMSVLGYAADDDDQGGIKLRTSTRSDEYDSLTTGGKTSSGYQVQVAAVATEETEVPLSVSDEDSSTRYSSIKAIRNSKKTQKPHGMSFSQMAVRFKSTPAPASSK